MSGAGGSKARPGEHGSETQRGQTASLFNLKIERQSGAPILPMVRR
jgi:hypothetical protein